VHCPGIPLTRGQMPDPVDQFFLAKRLAGCVRASAPGAWSVGHETCGITEAPTLERPWHS